MAATKDQPSTTRRSIGRLLFIADAAVADVNEWPPSVRSMIDGAGEVYVITPSLPGRLAWLADDVDRFRHVADKRLDTVLAHMRAIGADASGLAGRGSVSLVITDAVEEFKPTHVLIALRSPHHASWQERTMSEHVAQRFRLPVATYAVDGRGHTPAAEGPLLLCYDGSDDAIHAIEHAGVLFGGRHAVVVTVWQAAGPVVALAWPGASTGSETFAEADRAAARQADRLASDGVRVAAAAGLEAEPAAVEATGQIWTTILDIADRQDAATIVMGTRGLTGIRSMLLGSVSSSVVHHATRPALVVPRPAPAG